MVEPVDESPHAAVLPEEDHDALDVGACSMVGNDLRGDTVGPTADRQSVTDGPTFASKVLQHTRRGEATQREHFPAATAFLGVYGGHISSPAYLAFHQGLPDTVSDLQIPLTQSRCR